MQDLPVLFGVVSLGADITNLSLPKYKELFASNNIRIFSAADSPHINSFKDDNRFIAINGAVYSPFIVSSGSVNSLVKLSKKHPSDIDGNFVILKVKNDSFSIINDKFGSRLLLYCINNKKLFFSTNLIGLKVLLEGGFPNVDGKSLIHYYHFGFTESNRTLFNGIHKLPAGSILSVTNKKVLTQPYFNLLEFKGSDGTLDEPEEAVAGKISNKLSQSIKSRSANHSVVPVAISGGVDSGFILKHLSEQGKSVIGYNLSYDGFYDEYDRIKEISREFGIEIKRLVVNANDLISSLEESNSVSTEPTKFNDAAMRLVALEAKKDGFRTLWDGDGADRLFFGMNRQLKYIKLFRLYKLLKKFKLIPLLQASLKPLGRKELTKLKTLINNWENNILPYPERKMLDFYDEDIEKEVFEMFVLKHVQDYLSFSKKYDLIDYFTYQSIMMCPEMFFYPPSELQSAVGMMPVSPYWDENLVSFSLCIPKSLKIKNGYTKFILRKAAALNGEEEYWMKPKIGLQSAYNFVIESENGKVWKEAYVQRSLKSDEFLMIKDHLKGNDVDVERLIFLELWKEKNNFL